jgi:hypothetical protein
MTISLSDHAAHWVQWYAELTGRSAERVIGDTVEQSLSPLAGDGNGMASWSDQEVLDAADSTMPAELQSRLSELLQRLDEGTISPAEQNDLEAINRICELENLRKARGLAEAVRRGLRRRLS